MSVYIIKLYEADPQAVLNACGGGEAMRDAFDRVVRLQRELSRLPQGVRPSYVSCDEVFLKERLRKAKIQLAEIVFDMKVDSS